MLLRHGKRTSVCSHSGEDKTVVCMCVRLCIVTPQAMSEHVVTSTASFDYSALKRNQTQHQSRVNHRLHRQCRRANILCQSSQNNSKIETETTTETQIPAQTQTFLLAVSSTAQKATDAQSAVSSFLFSLTLKKVQFRGMPSPKLYWNTRFLRHYQLQT